MTSESSGLVSYQIRTTTGPHDGAGTNARVYVELRGDKGTTGEIMLDSRGNNFERSKTDVFSIRTRDVGTPSSLRVRHDSSGLAPGWFLETVTVKNEASGKEWAFPCNQWLARREGDGKIERELTPA